MKISLDNARKLLIALGFANASDWPAKRLASKIAKLSEVADEDDEKLASDKDLTKLINTILGKLKEGVAITVTDPNAPADEPAAKGAAKKDAQEKAEKAKKEAPAKPAKTTGPGVRETLSRPYMGALILKKHAAAADPNGKVTLAGLLKVGVTEGMVTELDAAYGAENPRESMFVLRNAWHAIRGWITKDNEGDLQKGKGAKTEAPADADGE